MSTQTPKLPQRRTQLDPLPLKGTDAATRAASLTSLPTFGETFYPGWSAARFHRLLAKKLTLCLKRKIKRLIISVPPQHGKSRLASIIFAAWALTLHPTLRIFQAGHTGQLSKGFSREARALVQSDRYRQFFPDLINPRVNREDFWQTRLGGYYFATSVGGGTGMPADILLIDDPHKDRAEAESETQRQRVWEWFTSTAMTRLAPDGVVIVIQTRWHEDDLAGRLQDPKRIAQFKEAGFDDMNFEVLSLEAICENPAVDALCRKMNEPLWPEVRSLAWLQAQKISIGSFDWNSLYQQRPNPPGGKIANLSLIKYISADKVPTGLEIVRGWDLAVSKTNLSDYSAGAKGCLDRDGNFYLMHMDRARRLWPDQKAALFKYIELESIGKRVGIEAVGAWEVAATDIREHFKGRVLVQSYTPTSDKLVRALPWIAKIDAGKFFIVTGGTWAQDFLDELKQFPNGTHDDQVDAVTVLWEMLGGKHRMVLA